MTIDRRMANRFLLIAGSMLLLAWAARTLWLGGAVGGPDVVVALAVATLAVASSGRSGPRA